MRSLDKFGYVLATKRLVDGGGPVGFMYHERGDGSYSGWSFLVGDETQEELDDPENLGIYSIETILSIDPDVGDYLECGIGTAFERDHGGEIVEIAGGIETDDGRGA